MLEHLHIENYRLFKELHLEPLRRVNLITGKNNTGKTAILEAIRIEASEAEGSVLADIVKRRDDFEKRSSQLETFKTLLNDKKTSSLSVNQLTITTDFQLSFRVTKQGKLPLSTNSLIFNSSDYANNSAVFVPATLHFDNIQLWKEIDLSPRKRDVVSILNIIEKNIVDIGLDIETKIPKILLKDDYKPIPLKNLGDGTSRIFTIALALVNAKNKILLIDEIDLGLHHSVQRKLWEIIFKFSKELNVQVFATTHSQDCVAAFTDVLNEDAYQNEGQYIRLQRSRLDESVIEPIYYDAQKLKNSINYHLETR